MKDLVSIIVPVYNVEPYLARCLDSLLASTDQEIEIIVVEDGSTDQSRSIVEMYECQYPTKIIAIYQRNQGLSAARNHGLARSKGEFIVFVDSDDYISPSMIETMRAAMGDGVSIVETQAYFAYDNLPPTPKKYQTKHSITKAQIHHDKAVLLSLALTAHSKMYRRELVESIPFPLGLVHEDVYFTSCLYPKIESVVKLETGGYYHYQRSDSITSTYNHKIYDMLKVQQLIVETYQQSGLYSEYQDILEKNAIRTLVISTIGRKMGLLKPDCLMDRKERYQQISEFIRMNFPLYRKNPYLNTTEKIMTTALLRYEVIARLCWSIGPKVIKR